ncbi:hypothetical protein SETIT_9G547800v2 [Setaria italica]|uniref:Uncharacterized protein n=1 Tax=Setaria italica TaxID=4555 RepID=A0A368SW90_SETIT|nr:hypothetical protein SETIT_9G547800v2 [Setaria italica]
MALMRRETERTEPPAVSMAQPSRHAHGHEHLLVTTGAVCARTRTRARVRACNTAMGCRSSAPRPRACSNGRAPSRRTTPPQRLPPLVSAASAQPRAQRLCRLRSPLRPARAARSAPQPCVVGRPALSPRGAARPSCPAHSRCSPLV